MASIDDLLARATQVGDAVDELVAGNISQTTQSQLARGIAVSGFVAVEKFFNDRSREWDAALTNLRLPPLRLPDGGMRFGNRLIAVLTRQLSNTNAAQQPQLLQDVANSVSSLSSGSWVAHHAAFGWTGSNLQAADVPIILALLGVQENIAWGQMTQMWQRIDPHATNSSLKNMFDGIAALRHHAAHHHAPTLPIPSLSALPKQIKTTCLCFDAVGSWAILQMRASAGNGFSATPSVTGLPIRRVNFETTRWAEYGPTASVPYRRHATDSGAMNAARGRATAAHELILVKDGSGEIINWALPGV